MSAKYMAIPSIFNRWGLVYIVQCGDDDVYKIGITRSSPSSRLAALQTGCPYDLILRLAWPVVDAEGVEARLHEMLVSVQLRGEWFRIDEGLAVHVMGMLRAEADYYKAMRSIYGHLVEEAPLSLPDGPETYFDVDVHEATIAWGIRQYMQRVVADAEQAGILESRDGALYYGTVQIPSDAFLQHNPDLLEEIKCKTMFTAKYKEAS